jgi:hypothetical protein
MVFGFFRFGNNYCTTQESTISILKKEANRTIQITIPDTAKNRWIKGGLFNY